MTLPSGRSTTPDGRGQHITVTTTDPDAAREYRTFPLTTDNVASAHITIAEEWHHPRTHNPVEPRSVMTTTRQGLRATRTA